MPHLLYGAFALAGHMGEIFRTTINEYYIASDPVAMQIKTARAFSKEEKSLLASLKETYGASRVLFVTERDRKTARHEEKSSPLPRVKMYFKEGAQPEGWVKPAALGIGVNDTVRDKNTDNVSHLFVPPRGSEDFNQILNKVDFYCARAAAFLGSVDYQPGDIKGEADDYFGWEHSVWRDIYGFKPREGMGLKKCPVLEHAPIIYPVGENDFLLGISYWDEGDFELPETLSACRPISEFDFKAITGRETENPVARLERAKQGKAARTFWERATFKHTL